MEYKVIKSDRRTLAVQIKNGEVIVRAPRRISDGEIGRFVNGNLPWIEKHLALWQENQQRLSSLPPLTADELKELTGLASAVIPQRVRLYASLIGVDYGRITVRTQKTRWGSCTAEGNLSFNCLLMLAPTEVLDSVIVHELCHRKHMNHSKDFYAEIERVYPEYKKHNGWLKINGRALLCRLGVK